MVTVPPVVPEQPALRRDPVVAYMSDRFTRPTPVRGDLVLDITDLCDTIVEMLHCHHSQMYEWLPYNHGVEAEVPHGERDRKSWLGEIFRQRHAGRVADTYRQRLIERYGPQRGAAIRLAEAYEISEYAAPLDDHARVRLFGCVES